MNDCGQIGTVNMIKKPNKGRQMFTIEHEFDATVVTLVDEDTTPLREDVIINAFDDCVTVTQIDVRTDMPVSVTLSLSQLRDLSMALDLPEGSYRLRRDDIEEK